MLIIFKRILILFILCVCFLSISALAEEADISAQSAILYCSNLSETLYEHNADEKKLIASTTKIMTAIIVIENCDLDEEITIKPEWCAVEGSCMYLKPGESYTVKEVLTGMLLTSGNDAATALANYTAGSEKAFAELMNEKAKLLNMKNSSFSNPHGLDDENNYSTARDMALLADYCINNDSFREIVSMHSATVKGLTYVNHNRLLWEYEGCIGLKTGYTMAAGRTLVSCAERDGLRFICVTLNDPDDWKDHRTLLDMGFEKYKVTSFKPDSFSVSLPVVSAAKDSVVAVPASNIDLVYQDGDSISIELDVPKILFAGGLKGEKVGEIRVFINGVLAASENLVYTENITVDKRQKLTASERFKRLLDLNSRPYYISGDKND